MTYKTAWRMVSKIKGCLDEGIFLMTGMEPSDKTDFNSSVNATDNTLPQNKEPSFSHQPTQLGSNTEENIKYYKGKQDQNSAVIKTSNHVMAKSKWIKN